MADKFPTEVRDVDPSDAVFAYQHEAAKAAYRDNVAMLDKWAEMVEDSVTELRSRVREREDFLALTGGKQSKEDTFGGGGNVMADRFLNSTAALVDELERRHDADVELARDRIVWALKGRNATQRRIEELANVMK